MMKLKRMNRTYLILLVILVIVGALVSVGFFYAYQYTLQPNIKVAAGDIDFPLRNPQTILWLDMGRVSGQVDFNYHPINMTGEYLLVFSNPSSLSGRFISFTYTTHWPDMLWTNFTLLSSESRTVYLHANYGEQLGGTFWVSGGDNDVDFKILALTCNESISFSATLINTGSSDGFAEVAFTVDGSPVWSNMYFVPVGSTIPISGFTMIDNCVSHQFNIVVQNQYKP